MPHREHFESELSRHVWETKYRHRDPAGAAEADVGATWRRVAKALAGVEPRDAGTWVQRFYALLEGFRFLPGGRIIAGAGTGRRVTLFNCFVMGVIEDSLDGILDGLKEGALTMQQGGGVGYDFSTLRPGGAVNSATGTIASGPVSFMRIWDATCQTLISTGNRRGAMMATLRCDHPDIEQFVDAKHTAGELRNFNLSVLATDEFMRAVERDDEWPLAFPAKDLGGEAAEGAIVHRRFSGHAEPVACRVLKTVRARHLWARIMRATWEYAEPGVLFVDRINAENNLYYREHISATNPCGEIPLPPYGACNLGSLNLTALVRDPFSENARLDTDALGETARTAVRMLDNVIDASRYPLEKQAEQARGARRVGLGVTGLADALIMLGLRYGGEEACRFAGDLMAQICRAAYAASTELAKEKGAFPFFDRDAYLEAPFVRALPPEIRDAIARHGIRNSHLLAVAPAGTISILANGISNGVEPVFAARHRRSVLQADGERRDFEVADFACRLWESEHPQASLPPAYVDAYGVSPKQQLQMQAAMQRHVDNAISKTINVPPEFAFEDLMQVYEDAYRLGLKGCTAFRANPVTGEILRPDCSLEEASHCCSVEREAD